MAFICDIYQLIHDDHGSTLLSVLQAYHWQTSMQWPLLTNSADNIALQHDRISPLRNFHCDHVSLRTDDRRFIADEYLIIIIKYQATDIIIMLLYQTLGINVVSNDMNMCETRWYTISRELILVCLFGIESRNEINIHRFKL